MSEMIERVESVLREYEGEASLQFIARAVIEALGEPTGAMVAAGGRMCADGAARPDEPLARACWDAMIHQALKD